jgi:hypothetical protein
VDVLFDDSRPKTYTTSRRLLRHLKFLSCSVKNSNYGQTQTETFHLPAGAKYKITLTHIGTAPDYNGDPKPDYDYTLEFTSNSTDTAIKAIPEDSAGILGVHDESKQFFASGKDATLYIAWLKSETVVTIPTDRKRTKVGVDEGVVLTLKPESLPNPTWALTGDIQLSVLSENTGITTELTAGARNCSPTAEATINGEIVKKTFNVVEPTGVVMRQQPGTGIEHTMGIPSAGFIGNPYITPDDVSFASGNVEVREETCNPTVTGYYTYESSKIHAQGLWRPVVSGDSTNSSKVDTSDHISSGNKGSVIPSVGTFDWVIPMSFQVRSGGAKQFTTISHHTECDAAGTVSIQKDAGPFSAALNDPTVP